MLWAVVVGSLSPISLASGSSWPSIGTQGPHVLHLQAAHSALAAPLTTEGQLEAFALPGLSVNWWPHDLFPGTSDRRPC